MIVSQRVTLWRRLIGRLQRRPRGAKAMEHIVPKVVDDAPVALVGCMCHSTENLLNYYETSMVRAADDFYPKDMASQVVYAYCA